MEWILAEPCTIWGVNNENKRKSKLSQKFTKPSKMFRWYVLQNLFKNCDDTNSLTGRLLRQLNERSRTFYRFPRRPELMKIGGDLAIPRLKMMEMERKSFGKNEFFGSWFASLQPTVEEQWIHGHSMLRVVVAHHLQKVQQLFAQATKKNGNPTTGAVILLDIPTSILPLLVGDTFLPPLHITLFLSRPETAINHVFKFRCMWFYDTKLAYALESKLFTTDSHI